MDACLFNLFYDRTRGSRIVNRWGGGQLSFVLETTGFEGVSPRRQCRG